MSNDELFARCVAEIHMTDDETRLLREALDADDRYTLGHRHLFAKHSNASKAAVHRKFLIRLLSGVI